MLIHNVIIRREDNRSVKTESKLYYDLHKAIEDTVDEIVNYLIGLRYDEGRFEPGYNCYSKMKFLILNNDYIGAYGCYRNFTSETPDNNEKGFIHSVYLIQSIKVIE